MLIRMCVLVCLLLCLVAPLGLRFNLAVLVTMTIKGGLSVLFYKCTQTNISVHTTIFIEHHVQSGLRVVGHLSARHCSSLPITGEVAVIKLCASY